MIFHSLIVILHINECYFIQNFNSQVTLLVDKVVFTKSTFKKWFFKKA